MPRRHRRAYALRARLPDENSITRLIRAVLLERNDEYQLQNRYTQIEGIASLATPQIEKNPPLRLRPSPLDPMRSGTTPEITRA